MAKSSAFIKINQRDLAQLNKKLAYLKGYNRKELSSELGKTALLIVKTAQTNVVTDKSTLKNSIGSEANGNKISVFATAKYAPYVEFGTGDKVDLTDMRELGIPEKYANQFRGEGFTGKVPVNFGKKGWRMVQFPIHLPARPFFFSSVRIEYKKMLERISKKIKNRLR